MGRMNYNSSARFLTLITTLLALFAVGVSAAITVTGDWPNDAQYRVEVYSAAQGNPCDANPDNPGELLYNSSTNFTNGNAYFDSNDEYSGTFELPTNPTTLHIYFCKTADPSGSSRVYLTRSTTDSSNIELDFGKVAGNDNTVDAIAGYRVHVCDALSGGNWIASSSATVAGDGAYEQYFYMDEPSVQVNGSNLANVYVLFDSDDLNKCTFDTTVKAGLSPNPNSALPYDYSVYVTDFSPETTLSSDVHADIAATGYISLYRNGGNNESIGMTGEITGPPTTFTLYYDNPATGTITAYVYTGAVPDTTPEENITNIALGTSGDGLDLTIKVSGSVPDDVATISTTDASGFVYTVAPTGASGSKTYALYIPMITGPVIEFKNSTGGSLFNYTYSGLLMSDSVLSVGKIYGEAHPQLTTDGATIKFFENSDCTTPNTQIQSVPVTVSGDAYTAYVVSVSDAGVVADYYPYIVDTAFHTCGAGIGNTWADRAINVNYTALVTGTVPSGITGAGGVYVDLNDNAARNAGVDPGTTNFNSGEYRIYLAPQGSAHNIVFASATYGTTELSRSKTAAVGNTTVNVAQVDWAVGNVHADMINLAGGSVCGGGATTPCLLQVVLSTDGTTAQSSEVRNFGATDTQYYEVPATGNVNFRIRDNADAATPFYAYNFTPTAGDATTFEPSAKVTMTAPVAIKTFSMVGGSFTYVDGTSTYVIYADKTEEAGTYTYNAYTGTDALTGLMLSRGTKDASTTTVWYINTVTNTLVHADLAGITDPLTIYIDASVSAACTGTAVSSTTAVALADGNVKYYESTLAAGNYLNIKVATGTNTTCINTLVNDPGIGAQNTAYSLNVKTSGSVADEIGVVYLSADNDANFDIAQTGLSGAPSQYSIYWAGDADTDMLFFEGSDERLHMANHNLAADHVLNVGRVNGTAKDALTTAVVYSGADCTTAVSTQTVDPTTSYQQFFEDTAGSEYLGVSDGTYTTCKSEAMTIAAEEATENVDTVVSGTVPDQDGTGTLDVRSISTVIDGAGNEDYFTDVGTNGSGTTVIYKLYVDSAFAAASVPIVFYDVTGGYDVDTSHILLSLTKTLADGLTVDVSEVNGNANAFIQEASDKVAVCYSTMPTNNSDCATKASTASVTPGATYQVFFEQVSAVTSYYLRVLDVDTVNYYSWNGFTSGAAGASTNVELDGQLSGYASEVYNSAVRIGNVLMKMYTNGGDADTNRVSTTYTYNDGTTASPTGNFVMYGDLTVTYDAQASKAPYITQTKTDLAALSTTWNPVMGNNFIIHVTTTETGSPTNITNATVSLLNCSSESVCNADTPILDACVVGGVADSDCTFTGNNTLGVGADGMYYIGIDAGTEVKVKVNKSGYITYSYPSRYDFNGTNNYTASDTTATTLTVVLVQGEEDLVAPTYEIVSVLGGHSIGGVQYFTVDDSIVVKFTASEAIVGTPVVTIGGASMTLVNYTGGVFTYAATAVGTEDPDAIIAITGGADAAGNAAVAYTDGGANAEFDFTAPAVSNALPVTTQNSRSFLVSVDSDALYCAFDTNNVAYDAMGVYATKVNSTTFVGTLVVPTDGTYTVYFACVDRIGNENRTNTGSFLVNATAPTIVASSPQGGYKNTTVTLNVTTDGAANCKYDTQDRSYATMAYGFATGNGSTAHTTTVTPSAQGDVHYYVACADPTEANAMSEAIVLYTNYDSVAPTIYRSSPDGFDDYILYSSVLSDEPLGTIGLTFDGDPMTATAGNGTLYVFTIDTEGDADGVYEVALGACADLAGNPCVDTMGYYPYNVTIDTEAPGITSSNYNENIWMLSVNTNESAAACRWSYNNESYDDMPFAMSTNNYTLYTATVHPIESSDPSYVFVACSDLYGNAMATNEEVDVSVDTIAPELINAGPGTTNSSSFTAWVQTNEAATCEYADAPFAYGSGSVMATGSGTNNHTIAFTNVQDGPTRFYVKCQDTAGNTMAVSQIVTLLVDTSNNFQVAPVSLTVGWNSLPSTMIMPVLSNLSFLGGNYSISHVLEEHGGLYNGTNATYNFVYAKNATSGLWASYVPGSGGDLVGFNASYDSYPGYVIRMVEADRLELQDDD